jgi:WD40 repeat protein
MNFDNALSKIINHLKKNQGATNGELIELIEGDSDLFEKVREHLIFNDLAEDKKGVGLVYLQQDNSGATHVGGSEKQDILSAIEVAESPARSYKIFISYGRKDSEDLAHKIADDLKEQGHHVWLDKEQIKTGLSWEEQIEEAILANDIFICLLSPHAVRRPDGVCLDEISMARFHNRKIVPVMVLQCRPPLSIYRLDWVDFQEWSKEQNYKRALSRILNALHENGSVEGSYADVFSKLKPLDFGVDISHMIKDFTGRRWLFDEVEYWLTHSSGKVFIISGDPGIGKSSIMAQLASKHPQVMAFHFCISSLADSINPDVFVRSIASQLATQIKEYHEAIKQIDFGLLTRLDSGTLFRRLIADPLKSIELNEQVVILIDALDESWTDSNNNIVRVLHERIEDLPDNVKVVVSLRKIPDILDLLSKYKPNEIDPARLENILDISAYLDRKFSEHKISEKLLNYRSDVQHIKNLIIRKSEGNFLYIKQFIYGVETDRIDISDVSSFPDGLIGIYITYFDRIFSKSENYDDFRSILEIITCLKVPFSSKELSPILQLSEFEIRRKMQILSAFFPERKGRYYPYHKSITDWLTGTAGTGSKYLLDMDRGRKLVCEFMLKRYAQGDYDSYLLTYLPYHLIESEKYSELVDLLLDFNFSIQKCSHNMVYELIKDYHAAFAVLPEVRDLMQEERKYIERMSDYTSQLILNPKLVQDKKVSIDSFTPWSDKQINDEIERIKTTPSKRDKLILFLQFLNAQAHLLFRYGSKAGYLIQQAYNYAGSGPFASYVDNYIKKCNSLKLLFTSEQRDEFNPFNPCLRVLQEHTERVHGVSITFDGKHAVSGSNDNSLKLWDLQSGECLKTIRPHIDYLKSLDATPDLNLVVTSGGSQDPIIRLWNYKDLESRGELIGHTDRVNRLKMTPDGRFVISGSNDFAVKIWGTTTKLCIADFDKHTSEVVCVDISPDCKTGVSGGYDNTLYVWDIPNKKCTHSFEGIKDLGHAVKLSSDNKILYSCCGYDDKTVKVAIQVWDLISGQCIKTLYGHEYAINCLETTDDGKFLISASMDKTIKIWNLNTYSCIKTIEGHIGPVRSLKLTPDMKYIISGGGGGYDNTVRIWDIYKSKLPSEKFGLFRNINHINFSFSGKYIVNSSRKLLQLRDPDTGKITNELAGHRDRIRQIRLNRDGSRIISAGLDKTIRIWNPESGKCTDILEGHTDGILDLSVSKDEKKMVSCGWDKQIILWDLKNKKKIISFPGHDNSIVNVAYLNDDERVLSVGSDGVLKLWDSASGTCLDTLQNENQITSEIALDRKNNLYLGYMDGSIQCWDLQKPCKLLKFAGHTGLVSCLELVEEENTLFSGSIDHTIHQWDITTGDCIKEFKGHGEEILFIRKVTGKNLIITASRDYTLRVWDIYSGECIAILSTNLLVTSISPVQKNSRFAFGTLQGEFKIVELKGA